jgi:membrane-bound lytic murein transglycosylase F
MMASFRLFTALVVVLLAAAHATHPGAIAPPRPGGELIIATLRGPTTYFEDGAGGFAGLEFELWQSFAARLRAQPRVVVAQDEQELWQLLRAGKVHVAAAALKRGNDDSDIALFADGYHTINAELVINGEQTTRPPPLAATEVTVATGSQYGQLLRALGAGAPRRTVELTGVDPLALLERVAAGTLDATVADSHLVAVARHIMPELHSQLALGKPRTLAWALPIGTDPRFVAAVNEHFRALSADRRLARLIEKYFGHVHRLSDADVEEFLLRTQRVLPRYRPLFKQAQERSDLDWRLLAALAYQESHWDPLATSPTNVRGMMMLTEETAETLGVTDRLNPRESIAAGARYLSSLRDELPLAVVEPDRTWIALAAYNLGLGHLGAGRRLARKLGLSADKWIDLKRALPQLARPEVAASVGSSRARGGEAVIMVENVRTYYDILARDQAAFKSTYPELRFGFIEN